MTDPIEKEERGQKRFPVTENSTALATKIFERAGAHTTDPGLREEIRTTIDALTPSST